jgi:Protein of unknown function (DUF1552)
MIKPLSRRTFLQGSAATIALPLLDAMVPWRNEALAQASMTPKRMVTLYFPNGGFDSGGVRDWAPGPAENFLPDRLAALRPYASRLILTRNLRAPNADIDGAGDHARSGATFLTQVRAMKDRISVGISADQVVANSLQRSAGSRYFLNVNSMLNGDSGGDSGYPALYTGRLSWRSATEAETTVRDAQAVFRSLFPAGSGGSGGTAQLAEEQRIRIMRKSILDSVLGQTQDLKRKLGTADNRRIDQYLNSIREVEMKLIPASTNPPPPMAPACAGTEPGANLSYNDHVDAMMRIIVLAMQCDRARVITYQMEREGSERNFGFAGINFNHHSISHHADNPGTYVDAYRRIIAWYVSKFANFLQQANAVAEGGGTLLDNAAVIFGSSMTDGMSHQENSMSVILAGRAGGSWRTGRGIDFQGARFANVLSNIIQYMGARDAAGQIITQHGDSNGTAALG